MYCDNNPPVSMVTSHSHTRPILIGFSGWHLRAYSASQAFAFAICFWLSCSTCLPPCSKTMLYMAAQQHKLAYLSITDLSFSIREVAMRNKEAIILFLFLPRLSLILRQEQTHSHNIMAAAVTVPLRQTHSLLAPPLPTHHRCPHHSPRQPKHTTALGKTPL